jgi:hypothetical protein
MSVGPNDHSYFLMSYFNLKYFNQTELKAYYNCLHKRLTIYNQINSIEVDFSRKVIQKNRRMIHFLKILCGFKLFFLRNLTIKNHF